MNWTIFLLMLPHLKPKCLDILNPSLYRGLDLLRILSLLIICALFLRAFLKERRLPSPPSFLLGALEAWICLVTVYTHGDYVETCSLAVSVMAIVLLVDLYAHRMRQLLTTLMLNYEWILYANLYTLIRYPDGLVRDPEYADIAIWFFGPDNWFMYLCIPAVCVALLYLRLQCSKSAGKLRWLGIPRALCLLAAAYYTVFTAWTATAVVALSVLAAVLVIAFLPLLRYLVSFPMVLLCGVGADLAFTVHRVMNFIPALQNLILNILRKDLTLSRRSVIWDYCLEQIPQHRWLGLGTPVGRYEFGKIRTDHMHNQAFDLLIQGGIPALALFVCALLLSGFQLTRHFKTPSARIMTAVMAGLMAMCVPEVCRHGSIFLLFPLAYHVQNIEAACRPKPDAAAAPSESENT